MVGENEVQFPVPPHGDALSAREVVFGHHIVGHFVIIAHEKGCLIVDGLVDARPVTVVGEAGG